MITTRTKTSISITTPLGGVLRAEYGKGQALSDIICNLIRHTGLINDPDAVKQIKDELAKAN